MFSECLLPLHRLPSGSNKKNSKVSILLVLSLSQPIAGISYRLSPNLGYIILFRPPKKYLHCIIVMI